MRRSNAADDPLELQFYDERRWKEVEAEAKRLACMNYEKRRVPDFPLRLSVVRTLLGLSPDIWMATDLARAMFGGDRSSAAIKFNKFKQGKTNLDEGEASLFACFINYMLDDGRRPTERPSTSDLLDFSQWMLENPDAAIKHDVNRIIAGDVGGDLFQFASKLRARVILELEIDGQAHDTAAEATVHDLLMEAILSPFDFVDWDHRLNIQHPRERFQAPDRTRFGADQKSGTAPRKWVPRELIVGRPVEYRLSKRWNEPIHGWFVTVRDPWPIVDGYRADTGTWIWDAGWENAIRWTASPFSIDAAQEVLVPTSRTNIVLDIPGIFHCFLIIEPTASSEVRKALGLTESGALPDEQAYFRLIDALPDLAKQRSIELYGGNYLVVTQ